MKLNLKKGLNAVIMVIATLGLATITIAIYAIIVQAFRNSQVSRYCTNSTTILNGTINCFKATNHSFTSANHELHTLAYNISNSGLGLFTGLTGQFSTIGQVSGVLVLFAVMALFGIGGYMAFQGMNKKP